MSMTNGATKFSTKILVVDDERLIRLVMCSRLKKAGYDTMAASSVDEAVAILKKNHGAFCAILSDIMMGDMDGFVFRDIVRGIDASIPFFFLTAMDPEEGSGFLKRIVEDPMSFYLPKAVDSKTLVTRVQRIVASRRVEQFIVRQIEETKQALNLAAYVQKSMLPPPAVITDVGFYSLWWRPKETVSGDLVEAAPFGTNKGLYILGDIQGHGTSAALAMTAVQSTLKRMTVSELPGNVSPADIANALQEFFRTNLADVSYMTALICLHDAAAHTVRWLSCGAPDLVVYGESGRRESNPEKRGGLPIGLMPDTRYGRKDEVLTTLEEMDVCVAATDGIYDISRPDGAEITQDVISGIVSELAMPAHRAGAVLAMPCKAMTACEERGYTQYGDDVTILCFGDRPKLPGTFTATVRIDADDIDRTTRLMASWCADEGWSDDLSQRLQLVLEEKLMNIHDHGFDERERVRHSAAVRLRKFGGKAELTVWDSGTTEPSMAVAAGDADTAFELANRGMSGHGRGRLMLRKICSGIARNKYGNLNETIYYAPLEDQNQ